VGDQFRRVFAKVIGIACAPSDFDTQVAPDHPARFLQSLQKRGQTRLAFRVIGTEVHEHADASNTIGLRVRSERPQCGRSGKKRDELPPSHSITSSAVICMINGTARPSFLAVFRLITNSNLLDCMTGRSPGFSPLRIRPAYTPAWR
jgi:hypothetical protein